MKSAAYRRTTCGVRTLDGKLRCELPAGHVGAHMHFGTNGTTAWGFTVMTAATASPDRP